MKEKGHWARLLAAWLSHCSLLSCLLLFLVPCLDESTRGREEEEKRGKREGGRVRTDGQKRRKGEGRVCLDLLLRLILLVLKQGFKLQSRTCGTSSKCEPESWDPIYD